MTVKAKPFLLFIIYLLIRNITLYFDINDNVSIFYSNNGYNKILISFIN